MAPCVWHQGSLRFTTHTRHTVCSAARCQFCHAHRPKTVDPELAAADGEWLQQLLQQNTAGRGGPDAAEFASLIAGHAGGLWPELAGHPAHRELEQGSIKVTGHSHRSAAPLRPQGDRGGSWNCPKEVNFSFLHFAPNFLHC